MRDCLKNNKTELRLKILGLTTIPACIPEQITTLILDNNELKSLPENLQGNIKTLYASSNQLGTVAKLAMRQPFVLFKGLTFQKLCLPGAFRPGDHHNKMLRPGLCVVHASPQYL
ncbi:leucine-rich repeat protein [Salmonella enterica subsp. enterica serovar Typhi]|nr:leucine-rich repeat protein [Salmonella enterica subsp. enterica serovar Typhi]